MKKLSGSALLGCGSPLPSRALASGRCGGGLRQPCSSHRKVHAALLSELGIALIVAGVVACLFEIYRSAHHKLEGMIEVINAVQGERMSPEVWRELDDLMSDKQVIRRDVHVRVELLPLSGLPLGQRALRLDYDYELHSLTRKKTRVRVAHELDYQLENPPLSLPRFGDVTVVAAPRSQTPTVQRTPGRVSFETLLGPRGKKPCFVHTERTEIVHIPGSYNLYTPEFVKGLTLTLVGFGAIGLEVWVRPHGRGTKPVQSGNMWVCSHLLLPGQGVEIKFRLGAADLSGMA
jgi:hypothetical protein